MSVCLSVGILWRVQHKCAHKRLRLNIHMHLLAGGLRPPTPCPFPLTSRSYLPRQIDELLAWQDRAQALQTERAALVDAAQGAHAGLQVLLQELASISGALDSERGALSTLAGDMVADRGMLQAQCDAYQGESSSMLAKMQLLWDEKEALEATLAETSGKLEAVSGRHVAHLCVSVRVCLYLCVPARVCVCGGPAGTRLDSAGPFAWCASLSISTRSAASLVDISLRH